MLVPAGEAAGMRRLRRFLWGDVAGDLPAQESLASSAHNRLPARDTAADRGESAKAHCECGSACVQPPASDRTATEATNTITAPIQSFKDSRMMAFGVDNSAKLSAHLAAGCLSPPMVHAAVMEAAETQGAEQCGWLVMHLIIRCARLLIECCGWRSSQQRRVLSTCKSNSWCLISAVNYHKL
jgi:deoxyribodipyrimidine photolyase